MVLRTNARSSRKSNYTAAGGELRRRVLRRTGELRRRALLLPTGKLQRRGFSDELHDGGRVPPTGKLQRRFFSSDKRVTRRRAGSSHGRVTAAAAAGDDRHTHGLRGVLNLESAIGYR